MPRRGDWKLLDRAGMLGSAQPSFQGGNRPGGQQQRVATARALQCMDPTCSRYLDEPNFGASDSRNDQRRPLDV